MPAGFLSRMIETVDATMRSVQEREDLKQDGGAFKSLRRKAAHNIAEMGLSERHNPFKVDSRATSTKLLGGRLKS
jgi:hypothetical protein